MYITICFILNATSIYATKRLNCRVTSTRLRLSSNKYVYNDILLSKGIIQRYHNNETCDTVTTYYFHTIILQHIYCWSQRALQPVKAKLD